MRYSRLKALWTTRLSILLAVPVCLPIVLLADSTPTASVALTEVQQRQWKEALTAIESGRFQEGLASLDQLAARGISTPELGEVKRWVESFDKLERDRDALRAKDYERYVAWAKEDIRAQRWRHAIIHIGLTDNVVEEQETLKQQDWVKEAVQQSVAAAARYEKEGKWYKAAAIYVTLEDIYPENQAYRDGVERCQEHIRLQLTYSKDSDWRTEVSDISPSMATEAFKRMYEYYLRKPTFKESAIAAFKQLLMFTEEPKLASEFEKLANKHEVEEFRQRIRPWLTRTEQKDEVSLTDLVELFNRALRINKEIQLIPQTVLIREFVHGVLRPLDKFSDMLWPAETEEFSKHTQGKFNGVGISIRKDPRGPIRVISPLEDTPAYQAGIRPGDLITRINGKPSSPLTISRAVREITGPPDTFVTLTVQRPDTNEEFELRLKRAEITIYTIKGYQRDDKGQWNYMIDSQLGIAYVRMTNFSDDTHHELSDVLSKLRDEGRLRGLIFDLRGNPGGLLKSAVDVTNLFLTGEKEIVSTRDRSSQDMQVSTSEADGDHYGDVPMILMVNESSASASEIVSGALQVHHRALILGTRTYGKGSVQQVLPVSPDREAFIKLTTARYYLPNGRCLHRDEDSTTWGVDPDIELKLTPKEMIKIANMRVRQDILKGMNQKQLTKADYDKVFSTQPATDKADDEEEDEAEEELDLEDQAVKELKREDPNDWPEVDTQLEAALLLMRVHLKTNQPWPLKDQQIAATEAPKAGS